MNEHYAIELAYKNGFAKGYEQGKHDAIPVHCGECVHMTNHYCGGRLCKLWGAVNGMGDEGFCNYGERKDNT